MHLYANVQLVGLERRQDLNGTACLVIGWDGCNLELLAKSGKTFKAAPCNVVVQDTPDAYPLLSRYNAMTPAEHAESPGAILALAKTSTDKWEVAACLHALVKRGYSEAELVMADHCFKHGFKDQGVGLLKAAKHPQASLKLAQMYEKGDSVVKSHSEALRILNRSSGADVWYYLGELCLEDRVYDKAFESFEKAAGEGHTDAMGRCGYMYVKGLGRPVNVQTGFDWINVAAFLGNDRATSLMRNKGLAVRFPSFGFPNPAIITLCKKQQQLTTSKKDGALGPLP